MPEKIVHNLTTWKDEIELALVFWFIGTSYGSQRKTDLLAER